MEPVPGTLIRHISEKEIDGAILAGVLIEPLRILAGSKYIQHFRPNIQLRSAPPTNLVGKRSQVFARWQLVAEASAADEKRCRAHSEMWSRSGAETT